MFFKHLQGWGLHHFPGQPVPMPDHSFSKEIFPNIQSKPSLTQLEATASRTIASHSGEETNTCLTTTSFQDSHIKYYIYIYPNLYPPQWKKNMLEKVLLQAYPQQNKWAIC